MRAVSHIDALAASVVLVGACSSFDSSPSAGVPDAGADGSDVSVDASPPADAATDVRCERTAPFTSIRPVDGVNSPDSEAFPRVSADERVIYFQRSSASAGGTFFRASRAAAGDPFDSPVPVSGLPSDPRQPFVTVDELEILFTVRVGAEQIPEMRHARQGAVTEPFGEAAPYPIIADPYMGRQTPTLAANGAELFFSQIVSATSVDLYRATLAADGGFGTPEPLVTLNTNGVDNDAVLSPDLLSLYFYSDRMATNGKGSIWVAHRDTPTGPFRAPVRIEELVLDGGYTAPGSVSADGCRLYFYTDKDFALSGYDLYVAERSPR